MVLGIFGGKNRSLLDTIQVWKESVTIERKSNKNARRNKREYSVESGDLNNKKLQALRYSVGGWQGRRIEAKWVKRVKRCH